MQHTPVTIPEPTDPLKLGAAQAAVFGAGNNRLVISDSALSGHEYTITPPRRLGVIFDMDGTLVDTSSILHHVLQRPKDFDAFHSGSIDCPPHQWVLDLCKWLHAQGYAIVIVTARSSKWEHVTVLWLGENNVPYEDLYMRERFDQRPDYEIKRDIYEAVSRKYDIKLAVDDNPSVLRLWRELGIPTLTVPGWIDDPEPATAPW